MSKRGASGEENIRKRADEYTVADWVQTWHELYSKPDLPPCAREKLQP